MIDHPTRFIHPKKVAEPPRALVVFSRETGNSIDVRTQLLQSVVYAIRYINCLFPVAFHRIIVQHIQQRQSRTKFSSVANANAFGGFFTALNNIPAGTAVDLMVRGWDGATTATGGLVDFIRAHGSGQGNNRNLFFRFVFFQQREYTSLQIRALFGDPQAQIPVANLPVNPNAFAVITPGPAPVWWPPAGALGLRLEAAMRARVHPPFTHLDYLNTMANFHQNSTLQAARTADSTLTLFFVLSVIDSVKAEGAGIGADVFYNRNRNNFY